MQNKTQELIQKHLDDYKQKKDNLELKNKLLSNMKEQKDTQEQLIRKMEELERLEKGE